MESFGEKLRSTRESLGYSIEQIARDTHIAKKYLLALESEDFSLFPGETYLKGFLQNYSEYLGLDIEDMIVSYKNMKIQEQPIPLDQLLDQNKNSKRLPLILASLGVLIVIGGVVLAFVFANPFSSVGGEEAAASERVKEFTYEGRKTAVDAFKGFLIKVPVNNSISTVTLQKIADTGISLNYGDSNMDFIIGDEKHLDLNQDGRTDLAVILKEIFTEQNQKKARLALQPPETPTREEPAADAGDLELVERGVAKVVLENGAPHRFTIDLSIVKNCYLVYYLDKNGREEKLSYKGEVLSLSAERSADLRFSDGGAVKLIISGNELESARAHELFAAQIRWVKSEDGKYKLILVPVK